MNETSFIIEWSCSTLPLHSLRKTMIQTHYKPPSGTSPTIFIQQTPTYQKPLYVCLLSINYTIKFYSTIILGNYKMIL